MNYSSIIKYLTISVSKKQLLIRFPNNFLGTTKDIFRNLTGFEELQFHHVDKGTYFYAIPHLLKTPTRPVLSINFQIKRPNHHNKNKRSKTNKRSVETAAISTEDIFEPAKDIHDTNPMYSYDDASMDTSENGNDQAYDNYQHTSTMQSTPSSPSNNGLPPTDKPSSDGHIHQAIPDNTSTTAIHKEVPDTDTFSLLDYARTFLETADPTFQGLRHCSVPDVNVTRPMETVYEAEDEFETEDQEYNKGDHPSTEAIRQNTSYIERARIGMSRHTSGTGTFIDKLNKNLSPAQKQALSLRNLTTEIPLMPLSRSPPDIKVQGKAVSHPVQKGERTGTVISRKSRTDTFSQSITASSLPLLNNSPPTYEQNSMITNTNIVSLDLSNSTTSMELSSTDLVSNPSLAQVFQTLQALLLEQQEQRKEQLEINLQIMQSLNILIRQQSLQNNHTPYQSIIPNNIPPGLNPLIATQQ
jgi:hypothetical protein